jgi:RNA polymerase sigma factor (sigma-70 family)
LCIDRRGLAVCLCPKVVSSGSRERSGQRGIVSQATPSSPLAEPAQDERLHTVQAFSRFVSRITPHAGAWLARWCVPAADRDDVLQETFVRAYAKRETYDPAVARHVAWAYGILGNVVREYRRAKGRRVKRVDVAVVDLPDVAVDALSPEEETDQVMRRRLLETCFASLDPDSRAIILARDVDEIPMAQIAIAHGIALSTAYTYYQEARAQLQAALEREQDRKRALGALVLPIGLDQLLAAHSDAHDVGADTMARIWRTLDRRMAADMAAGTLGDDGTAIERYMGRPSVPRLGPLARALRALLDPRIFPALTGVVGAAGGALVMFAIMRAPPERHHDTAVEVRTLAPESSARAVAPLGSTATATGRSSGAEHEPELRPDAGAAERPAASATASAPPDDSAEEQRLFDTGSTAYQSHKYQAAIDAFVAHASKYPQGQFVSQRDRLWTLALIRAGRTAEAHERIERLRRTSPDSPALKEFDEALSPKN